MLQNGVKPLSFFKTALAAVVLSALMPCSSYATALNTDETALNPTGLYLSARYAQRHKDWDKAAGLMQQGYPATAIPDDMVKPAFIMALGAGHYDYALSLSGHAALGPDIGPLGTLLKSLDAIKRGDMVVARLLLQSVPHDGLNAYARAFIMAWLEAEQTDFHTALGHLEALPTEDEGIDKPLFAITAAQIADYKNQPTLARPYYDQAMSHFMTLESAIAVTQFYARQKDNDKAAALMDYLKAAKGHDNGVRVLDEQIATHQTITPPVSTIHDGIAASLHDLTSFLYEQKGYESALVFARLTHFLNPHHDGARFVLGDLMVVYDHLDNAQNFYASFSPQSPRYTQSLLRLFEAYERDYAYDKAVHVIDTLIASDQQNPVYLMRKGDLMRRNNNFSDAIRVYDTAETLMPDNTALPWDVLYARALCHDATDNWNKAEQDLKSALLQEPDHPLILNYLAYNWVERGEHLDKAQTMLEKAVHLKPNNAHILDSLGWAYFKRGDYDRAIDKLEQAIALMPFDHHINDHLGDAYWQAGRFVEARYQWQKAINSIDKDSKNTPFIYAMKNKIEWGLDGVRQNTTAFANSKTD